MGGGGRVTSMAVAVDGRRLVAGFSSGVLHVWDLRTAEMAQTAKAHDGSVNSLALAAVGTLIVSGGDDGRVHVWNPASDRRSVVAVEGAAKSLS